MPRAVPGYAKCIECGTMYSTRLYFDCPECCQDEFDRYIQDLVARRILESRFRCCTPPNSDDE